MYRALVASILALALIGCVTPLHIPVSQETIQSVKATRAVVLLNQEEIVADFEPARGGAAAGVAGVPGIGLFIALAVAAAESAVVSSVNAGRAKEAETQAAPVRDALLDYNFRASFEKSVTRELSNVGWVKLTGVKHDSPKTELAQIKTGLDENAVLLLNTRYSLSPGLKDLRIWCAAALVPNDPQLNAIAAKERPGDEVVRLYRNEFIYTQPLPVAYESPEQAARAWSDGNGRLIRTALEQGTDEITKMLTLDVRAAEDTARATAPPAPVEYGKVRGVPIAETADRAILRLQNGSLQSVPRDAAPAVAAQ
jgi:hypothetical protein